jgi:pyridoxal phosphate enzyme (YggS family)
VRARIDAARQGRSAAPRLLAVTKSVGPELAGALVELGVLDLGENRVEGLRQKVEWFAARPGGPRPRFHFLGHLQRNKARKVVQLADQIHTVDGLELLASLERLAAEERRRPRIFVQCKLAPEAEKTGLAPEQLPELLARAAQCEHLELAGLMCMAPLVEDPREADRAARETFARLAQLAHDHRAAPWCEGRALLSMGMSADLEAAVEAGSDWLRIGTALFEGLEEGGAR